MRDYYSKLEEENQRLRSIVSSINSENEIERDFLYLIAQSEEDLSGEGPDRKVPQGNPDDLQSDLTSMEPQEEQRIEDILSSDDEKPADLLEWNNFSIQQNKEFANKLQQEQGLSIDDALKQSYYIEYRNPQDKELLAVQGNWFGFNREQGEGIKFLGGYGTEEEIGGDLKYMKENSESGFPADKKDVLVTIDKLSPALQAFKEKAEKDNVVEFSNKPKEEDKPENEIKPDEEINLDEELKGMPQEETQESSGKSRTTPTSSSPRIPKPVGRVGGRELNMLKMSNRINALKQILKRG